MSLVRVLEGDGWLSELPGGPNDKVLQQVTFTPLSLLQQVTFTLSPDQQGQIWSPSLQGERQLGLIQV